MTSEHQLYEDANHRKLCMCDLVSIDHHSLTQICSCSRVLGRSSKLTFQKHITHVHYKIDDKKHQRLIQHYKYAKQHDSKRHLHYLILPLSECSVIISEGILQLLVTTVRGVVDPTDLTNNVLGLISCWHPVMSTLA